MKRLAEGLVATLPFDASTNWPRVLAELESTIQRIRVSCIYRQ